MVRRVASRWILAVCLMASISPPTFGQEVAEVSTKQQRELAEKKLLDDFKMLKTGRAKQNTSEVEVPLLEKPLLYFEDPTRANTNGALHLWSTGGRPTALLESYQVEDQLWVMLVNQLDEGNYQVTFRGEPWWTPQKTELEWRELQIPEKPSENFNQRSLQFRSISRRFAAHQFWDPNNSRFELRLHARPLHRYSEESRNIADGAVFVFSNGTNPEIALLIEAQKAGSKLIWSTAFARIGHAEMHVSLEGKPIWTVPRVNPQHPTESYWLTFVRMDK